MAFENRENLEAGRGDPVHDPIAPVDQLPSVFAMDLPHPTAKKGK